MSGAVQNVIVIGLFVFFGFIMICVELTNISSKLQSINETLKQIDKHFER